MPPMLVTRLTFHAETLLLKDEAEEKCEHTSMQTTESGMVLPPATDEDRQVGPALYHEQSQGGPTKSKLKQSEIHDGRDRFESF